MNSLTRAIGLLAVLGTLGGCASQSSVATSNAGTTKVFASPYAKVQPAALETVQGLNVEVKGSQPEGEGSRILFSKPVSAWSWGEVGSVLVKPIEEKSTLVIVNTEKRSQLQVTGTDEKTFSDMIFDGIQEVLDRE